MPAFSTLSAQAENGKSYTIRDRPSPPSPLPFRGGGARTERRPSRGQRMAHPHVYSTEAICLRRTDFGEADRILTLFTPAYGKVRAIAKGVRRTTSRLAGHL